ncbi:hypothetical protein [Vibrio quintilis]|uniref:hypothetical protein n=1 Tax=Vibrio quintilis TaxID=1117707 RepID=UPI0009362AF3|nr:hypothetical protein [Vibrio quintilis]
MKIDPAKGSATGYIPKQPEDAWAACWGIRAFKGVVTAGRELMTRIFEWRIELQQAASFHLEFCESVYLGLKVTGKLDFQTLSSMSIPKQPE